MGKVLFLRQAHRVVSEKDDRIAPGKPLNRVVHVDPDFHGLGMGKAGSGRAQLHRGQGSVLPEPLKH
jgi:hypothetical protein